MSGIVGMYYLDGRPIEREMLGRMVHTLAHRGPDGFNVWCEGCVGLGHRTLWTTPESLFEKLPLVDQTVELAITADVRLDNRTELIAALSFANCLPDQISDSQLILCAYVKWGTRCPEQLLGDFSFAIWDRRQRQLFCARDHVGIKPFYYYRSGKTFAFASEIKGLLCLPEVPRALNELRVADYLANLFDDKSITFYQDIYMLPPAHIMMVTGAKITLKSYWSLDPSRELRLRSDEEYADAFRELFTEAVRCRLRSAFPIGSTLSGGLDSSSVTCVARKLIAHEPGADLHTFSLLFESIPQCDERAFINSVVAQGDLIPHNISADEFGPFLEWERVYWHMDEPFSAPNTFMAWLCYRACNQHGIRVLLDGLDGDNVVSHGFHYLTELARGGDWATFIVNADLLSKRYRLSPHLARSHLQYFDLHGFPYLEELVQQSKWLKFAKELTTIRRAFPSPRRNLFLNHIFKPLAAKLKRRVGKAINGQSISRNANGEFVQIINRDFAQRVGLEERIRSLDGSYHGFPASEREYQWRILSSGILSKIVEIAHRIAPAFHVEPRHPFMDKRLIEFCIALPAGQKLQRGWTRMILRRAMSNIVPKEVEWRDSKSNLSGAFDKGLLVVDREILKSVIDTQVVRVKEYVDATELRRYYDDVMTSRNIDDRILPVWKAADLALWLNYTGLHPP
jgi:asparagine synthase (glutamine-hydrolysing)